MPKHRKKSKGTSQQFSGSSVIAEEKGRIVADANIETDEIRQSDITQSVDIQSAQKRFTLDLKEYGPYKFDYSMNGRFLALSGKKGHAAVIDWQPKSLKAEFNAEQICHDICWLHNETMYAVAQQQHVYIYDNQGIELHCLKVMDSPLNLSFLSQHFLLTCSNSKGYLSWLDVSIGEKVAGYQTGRGPLNIMTKNKQNGIVYLGHSRGTVTLWSPSSNKGSLVEILCHKAPVSAVAVDESGLYMATAGHDNKLKLWDLRTYNCLHETKTQSGTSNLTFSKTGLLASSFGSTIAVFQNAIRKPCNSVYLKHQCNGMISKLQFCPFEDILGVGTSNGFDSLLIPGAGEANIDTYEANPYQTVKSRQNKEVKQLLDKIPWQLISLESKQLAEVRSSEAKVKVDKKVNAKYEKFHYIPNKQVIEKMRREELRRTLAKEDKSKKEKREDLQRDKPYDALERFKPRD